MLSKRILDLVLTIPGLLLLLPLFIIISLIIKLDSSGPVFFRQIRVGRYGKPFRIYKFRTMVTDAESQGKQITVGADSRITRCGAVLRKYKLDELPQLINVLLGEMSLVGPRPEVPQYVECYPADIKDIVLSIPPGITDFASIEYKDENAILGKAIDPEGAYIGEIMPIKLSYYVKYARERTLLLDIILIFKTIRAIVT